MNSRILDGKRVEPVADAVNNVPLRLVERRPPMSHPSRRTLLLSLFAIPALISPRLATAGTKDALEGISKARASLKTLTAPFTQTRTLGLLASEVVSKGDLALVRPDRLRYSLAAPDAITYWVGPEGVAYKSATAKKAGKAPPNAGPFAAVLGDLLTFMGGDMARLAERYELSVPSESDGVTLVATPKVAEVKKLLSRLELRTTKELWGIRKITMAETNGDESVIVFGENQRDKPIDPASMKPPA